MKLTFGEDIKVFGMDAPSFGLVVFVLMDNGFVKEMNYRVDNARGFSIVAFLIFFMEKSLFVMISGFVTRV